jgi:hypothetical protein
MARNWERARDRDRMRRHGVESTQSSEVPFMHPLLQPRQPAPPRPSKAQLRQQADAAIAAWKARHHDNP